jgi:hypothetical protein
LEVSAAAYTEITDKLIAAGYELAINADGEIDMHGIALVQARPQPAPLPPLPVWTYDPKAATDYARTHAYQPGLPPHWHRCDFMKDGVRCAKGSGHENGAGKVAEHEGPKA